MARRTNRHVPYKWQVSFCRLTKNVPARNEALEVVIGNMDFRNCRFGESSLLRLAIDVAGDHEAAMRQSAPEFRSYGGASSFDRNQDDGRRNPHIAANALGQLHQSTTQYVVVARIIDGEVVHRERAEGKVFRGDQCGRIQQSNEGMCHMQRLGRNP